MPKSPEKSGPNPDAPKISKIRTVAVDNEKLKTQELPRFKKSVKNLRNYGMTLNEIAKEVGLAFQDQ